jgi:hypothetical protein
MSALPDLEQERHPPQLFPPINKEIIVKKKSTCCANRVARKGVFCYFAKYEIGLIKF